MSSLKTLDLRTVDDLVDFVRGPGYVLDFSDVTFSQFFHDELGVDIDDPQFSKRGRSKGKRLKFFLQAVENSLALKTLSALWEYREAFLLRSSLTDPISNAGARYQKLVEKLSNDESATTQSHEHHTTKPQKADAIQLQNGLTELNGLAPQERGYAFEKWLKYFFDTHDLKAQDPFRMRGDQIDGSFQFGNETYLIEAKWTSKPIGVAELHTFHGKIEQRAAWARGLFISYSGFTAEGLDAFGKGKRVICMDGFDISELLRLRIPFTQVLEAKVRKAAETGHTFVRVRDLFPS